VAAGSAHPRSDHHNQARAGIIFFYIILIFDPDALDAAMAEPRLIIG
jgi:hypothetical protein